MTVGSYARNDGTALSGTRSFRMISTWAGLEEALTVMLELCGETPEAGRAGGSSGPPG